MKWSLFGEKFTQPSGITSLMDDLGNALASVNDLIMMGGGNPGDVPEVSEYIAKALQDIYVCPKKVRRLVGIYDPPKGNAVFIDALVKLFRHHCGWDISRDNIVLTNGSQTAFFMLFNLLAGPCAGGQPKKIHLPVVPEYIGYADTGVTPGMFRTTLPRIEEIGSHFFKYYIDFESLNIDESVAALCVSRPTNPTGNVLTDDEMQKLDQIALEHDIPLIIDGAYGRPFPDLIYTDASLDWHRNRIICLSLSKLGLPATRTGIVIAKPEIIEAIGNMNAIMSLSPNSIGSMLATELVQSGEILKLSEQSIQPFYQNKAQKAIDRCVELIGDYPIRLHKTEGAMFLWLWMKDFPVTSFELYERLKQKGVLVVSGHYFFMGQEDHDWPHKDECIRVTYSQVETSVMRGLEIIIDEIKSIYDQSH